MSHVSKALSEMQVENLMVKIEESLVAIQLNAAQNNRNVGDDHKTVKLILDIERIRKAQFRLLRDLNRTLGSYYFD